MNFDGYDGCRFVEVKNRQDALDMLNSKTSCCWSAGTVLDCAGEYISLASPSQRHDDKRTIFYCRADLVKAD